MLARAERVDTVPLALMLRNDAAVGEGEKGVPPACCCCICVGGAP
jgi:hypothetical protein